MMRWLPGALLLSLILCGCARNTPVAAPVVKGPSPTPMPSEAAQYYGAVNALNQKLTDASREFEKGITAAITGQLKDLSAVKTAQDQMTKAVESAQSELKAIKVPDLKGAKELHEAEARYLDGVAIPIRLQGQVMEIVQNAMAKGDLSNIADVQKKLGEIQEAQQKAKQDLDRASESFVKQHLMKGK